MKPLTSKITSKGQTTIPFEIRKSLQLAEGDLLFYEIGADHAVRFRKLEKVDFEWAQAIETTMTEWQGDEDNDL